MKKKKEEENKIARNLSCSEEMNLKKTIKNIIKLAEIAGYNFGDTKNFC